MKITVEVTLTLHAMDGVNSTFVSEEEATLGSLKHQRPEVLIPEAVCRALLQKDYSIENSSSEEEEKDLLDQMTKEMTAESMTEYGNKLFARHVMIPRSSLNWIEVANVKVTKKEKEGE